MAEIHNGHVSLGRRSSSSMEEIRDLEVGVAGASGSERTHQRAAAAAAGVPGLHLGGRRRPSYRTMGSFSPRSNGVVGRFFCEPRSEDEGHHFLDACFLCKKPLGGHRDIFMYRGDTPFCSEECRQEQIDMDEGKEKNWTKLAMKAASSRKEQKPNSTQTIHVRAAGAIVAG